jgi:hypothetical protein
MKNLNKFTKTELINKIKNFDNQNNNNSKSILIKIVEYILLFKSLILKFTLLALLIRWFKKYSLLKRLWHIFSWIASTLLGITLIDIYSLDVFNWIKETNIYKWLYELFNSKEIIKPVREINPVKEIKSSKEGEFQFPKKITNQTDGNETRHVTFSEWLNRNTNKEVIKDESLIDKIKDNSKTILIISGVIIVSGLSWYYSNEIGTSIEWIKNYLFRPSSDPGTNSTKGNILNSTQSSRENFKTKFLRIISRNDEDLEIINILSEENNEIDIKGKGKLTEEDIQDMKELFTSPSLDDLNEKAKDVWSESSSLSPKSDSSSSTVTPTNYKPESSKSDSSSSTTPDNFTLIANKIISKDWKLMLLEKTQTNIKFIEETFNSDDLLNIEEGDKLFNNLISVISDYDEQVKLYENSHSLNWSLEEMNQFKISLYDYKKWIAKYHKMILPNEEILEIGSITDQPVKLTSWFFK